MNTPKENKDQLTYFKMFLEFWNDEELKKAVKKESELNTIKESVLRLKPLFEKTISDLFNDYFLEGQKEVEKWIDVWKNKEFLPEDEVKEKLKYWRDELIIDRQYNYFLDDLVKSGWVRDNSPANSKDELIKDANSVFYSGVRVTHKNHLGDKAQPTVEDHFNLAITFVKDNVRWVFHHAKIITINKYLSGKLSNEPTAKAKPVLDMRQIALIHIYSGKPISEENKKLIASQYGFDSKTSGQKLIQYYNKYCKKIDRTGDEGTGRKNKNKYNFIESILPYLENEKQQTAKNELEVIKKNYL